jgi:peptidoglycan/LPS O-acetylase OafA/YrhL
MVVIYHASLYRLEHLEDLHGTGNAVFTVIAYLFIGVPLFFVISGYCIAATCDSLRRKQRSVGRYLVRRYRRIFPPFWVVVGLSLVVVLAAAAAGQGALFYDNVHHLAKPSSLSLGQWLGNLTLTESWRYLAVGGARQYFLGPAWSLCYEEQFYLVCGLILFVAPRRFFAGSAVVTGVVVLFSTFAAYAGLNVDGLFCDGRWFMFALGIFVYWVINYAGGPCESLARICLAAASALGIVGLLVHSSRILLLNTDGFKIIAALVFATALVVLHPFDRVLSACRLGAPLTWCGVMCYSLYLVHWTFVKPISRALWTAGCRTWVGTLIVTVPLCLFVSVVLARAFHLIVERRFLNPRTMPDGIAPVPKV